MTFNLRTRAARNVATAAVVAGAVAGFCAYEANDFRKHRNELPCERLNLPKVAGAEPISENICIAVSGERPKRVGVESAPLPNGKVANTIFLEWDYDGFSEVLKHVKPDAEPVTLVTDKDGKPEQIQTRAHWRIGIHQFDDCKNEQGKAVIAITNSFHTPLVVGCQTNDQGSLVYKITDFYARLTGSMSMKTYWPLRNPGPNRLPQPDHPARSEPLYAER